MSADPVTPADVAQRLERGEGVFFPVCAFALPRGDDMTFLLEQQLASRAHKNVSYDPRRDRAAGFFRQSADQAERLRGLLADFARQATAWLAGLLPRYAASWKLDLVSYRPLEEATR